MTEGISIIIGSVLGSVAGRVLDYCFLNRDSENKSTKLDDERMERLRDKVEKRIKKAEQNYEDFTDITNSYIKRDLDCNEYKQTAIEKIKKGNEDLTKSAGLLFREFKSKKTREVFSPKLEDFLIEIEYHFSDDGKNWSDFKIVHILKAIESLREENEGFEIEKEIDSKFLEPSQLSEISEEQKDCISEVMESSFEDEFWKEIEKIIDDIYDGDWKKEIEKAESKEELKE